MRLTPPRPDETWLYPWRVEARTFWYSPYRALGWCKTLEEAVKVKSPGDYSIRVRAV